MAGKFFISYRRNDSAGFAGRVFDHLVLEFGRDLIFMDIDAIPLGIDFAEHLFKSVDECVALLAIIGPDWVDAGDRRGGRRLDDADDYVRQEIVAGLRRDILVIPILVDGAAMPSASQLPEEMADLVRRSALEVRHNSFSSDVKKLMVELRKTLDEFDQNIGPPNHFEAQGALDDGGASSNRFLRALGGTASPQIDTPTLEIGADGDFLFPVGDGIRDKILRLRPGDNFRDLPFSPEMVIVPAGQFLMGTKQGAGNDNEWPQTRVSLPAPFGVAKFPVTFDEWVPCWHSGTSRYFPNNEGWGHGRRPVINVSWHDAKDFVFWLSQRSKKKYRLLSEAEWEYVCRAGTSTDYSTGDSIAADQACFFHAGRSSVSGTLPVGQFSANAFGLHDLHGNVWEWVEDHWNDNLQGARPDGVARKGPPGKHRVIRGGSWMDGSDRLRSAYRKMGVSRNRFSYRGFRVAREL